MTCDPPPRQAPDPWVLGRVDAVLLALLATVVSGVFTCVLVFFANGMETMNCGLPPTQEAWATSIAAYAGLAIVVASLWILVGSLLRVALGQAQCRPWVWFLAAALAVALAGAHARAAANTHPSQEQCSRADFMS